MRIIAVRTLREFWSQTGHADSEQPLKTWFRIATAADWSGPQDVKVQLRTASIVADNRVVFNIAGNKYRLVVKFNYPYRVGYIRFVGTHKEYDNINVEKV